MQSIILLTLERLEGFQASRELVSTAQSFYDAAVGKKNSAVLPLICIHLACVSSKIQAPVSSILNNLPIEKDNYVFRYHQVSQYLNIPEPAIVITNSDVYRLYKNSELFMEASRLFLLQLN
jgi:hypothetical protein